MSLPIRIHTGDDLCGVGNCPNLQVAIADVPLHQTTVELPLCVDHYTEMHHSDDPIETARQWANQRTP